MNIQKRLRFSYILMLLIPIFFILLSGGLLRKIYSDDNENTTILSGEFLSLLYVTLADSPEKLLDREFLTELDFLSGYKHKTNIYIKKDGTNVISLENSHSGRRVNRHDSYDAVHYWDFYFSDNTPGLITINIYDATLVKNLFISGGISVLIVICALILTNGLLSYFVARSILNPIKILKSAALNIKNEELDFTVDYKGKDEFLDVCLAFEEMRIRLKDSLREQLKYENNRRELLSNISHDLKTPITAIKGYIEGIRDGIADSPEKVDKYLDTVYSKSVLLNDLIDRLFLFSKLDLNRVQFNFQTIDPLSFMIDTCEEFKFDYPNLEISVVSTAAETLKVSADSIHLHRVISNLIDNAVKYNDKDKTLIAINISSSDKMVTVKIMDNGKGISSAYLPHIFDSFYRTDKARSSMTEGSGLGLSISRQIISAHGGEISAESNRGKGTEITFTLRKAT